MVMARLSLLALLALLGNQLASASRLSKDVAVTASKDKDDTDKDDDKDDDASGDDDSGASSDADATVQGLQGAMAMSAMMPDQPEVQKPGKEAMALMDKGEPLIYSAYETLQSAENELEIAVEQMKMNMHKEDAAANLAGGKGLLEEAQKKIKEGKTFVDQAKANFQNNADPLGPPPQNPEEWNQVDSSLRRAEMKVQNCQSTLDEANSLAKQLGLEAAVTTASKGFTVQREQAVAYGKEQDDKLMAFLQQY